MIVGLAEANVLGNREDAAYPLNCWLAVVMVIKLPNSHRSAILMNNIASGVPGWKSCCSERTIWPSESMMSALVSDVRMDRAASANVCQHLSAAQNDEENVPWSTSFDNSDMPFFLLFRSISSTS